ncbi:MAG TPA: succinyl-diaminopimelate desuccinylase [Hyphomicrobiales bacterium]|nr:succinyl-diaminopimelate desuccinylase [Hyphomicrobiales bacterium]
MTETAGDRNVLTIAQRLIRCRSVTPDEGGALDYLEALLGAAGFACHRLRFADKDTPDVENLYARIGEGRPNLCFAGHTDVVPPGNEAAWSAPPFAGEVHAGMLYGRGAADMKGGIAAFAAAALDYLDAHGGEVPGAISLLITGDEEGPAVNGTAKLLRWAREHGEHLDHCLLGEPTNPESLGETIKIGRRGSLSGTIHVFGKQGHVAYPMLALNPIPGLVRLVAHLQSCELDEGSAHFQPSNLEFTSVDVGNPAFNVIPGEARAAFNIRFNDHWSPQRLEEWLREELDEAAAGEVDYSLVLEPSVSDVFVTEPGELTELVSAAVKEVTGREPELSTSGGTSDARFIKDHCPVVEFGLVGRTIHQTDEHVPLEDLDALTKIYRRLLDGYFERFGAQ